jgi:hypothetical protein
MQARKPTLITEGKCRLHQPEDKHGYLHPKDMRRTQEIYLIINLQRPNNIFYLFFDCVCIDLFCIRMSVCSNIPSVSNISIKIYLTAYNASQKTYADYRRQMQIASARRQTRISSPKRHETNAYYLRKVYLSTQTSEYII